MSASLHGRFCVHGIAGDDYCEDCHAEQVENCDHDWCRRGLGFNPDFGPSYECDNCGAVAP